MTQRLLLVQKHVSRYSDCASCRWSSGRCICDWYYSLTFSAIRQVLASYPESFPPSSSSNFQFTRPNCIFTMLSVRFRASGSFNSPQIGSGTAVVINFSVRVIVLLLSPEELNGHVVIIRYSYCGLILRTESLWCWVWQCFNVSTYSDRGGG